MELRLSRHVCVTLDTRTTPCSVNAVAVPGRVRKGSERGFGCALESAIGGRTATCDGESAIEVATGGNHHAIETAILRWDRAIADELWPCRAI